MAKKKKEAKKDFEDQLDGEEVVFVFRKHPIVMRKGFILAVSMLLIGVVPSLIKPEYIYLFGGLAVGTILAAVVFLPHWITWYFSIFIVTNQRFIQVKQVGFFHRKESDLSLSHIQSMNHETKGIEETMLGFGKITIQTYMGNMVLHDIHHPGETQAKIQEILRDNKIVPEELDKTRSNEE